MDDAIQELIYAAYGAEARLQRPGCCVRYWLRGDETTKPVVMFLHGAGVDHRMWASQIDAFAPQYRVLTLDLRGHGQSRPAGHYSFDAVVEDCFALLDRLNVERVPEFLLGLTERMHSQHNDLRAKIAAGDWSEEVQQELREALDAYAQDFGYDLDEEGEPIEEGQELEGAGAA